ncbi:cytochrome p450 domain-containing protein [Hirsutella rhossiliensis]|uniref:Cytochrome p450 domain-containing protein n=1 Tax=Hirsutella rhossiliensis TaxID=111463 RepID=A0A9P8MRE4_9HYPO|nr:cytochrome p450 domain-containing protein [Hirsutella rhossiliensis]KAH0960473.1 cytochrome p450 domain-containing protein [Hirsutella rhossiliensis]
MTSGIFLGDDIGRNEDWLRITSEYTFHSLEAIVKINLVPRPLRGMLHWFFADCKKVRRCYAQAQEFLRPIVENRNTKGQFKTGDKFKPIFNDSIDWAEHESNGHSYEPSAFQLILSFTATHNTTDLCTYTLALLASNPELFEPVRREMVDTLRSHGWKQGALDDLKLLDSAIKEAQRLKPIDLEYYHCRRFEDT